MSMLNAVIGRNAASKFPEASGVRGMSVAEMMTDSPYKFRR